MLSRVPPGYQSGALPLSYGRLIGVAGIEPFDGESPPPRANVHGCALRVVVLGALPLSYTPSVNPCFSNQSCVASSLLSLVRR